MRLSFRQRSRFISCIEDLRKLVALVEQVVPMTTIGKAEEFTQRILASLKKAPLNEYLDFALNQFDLILKVKVNSKGEIVGFAQLNGGKSQQSEAHFKLNHFISGSRLNDCGVEYFLE